MSKIKVKIVVLGHLPHSLNLKKIEGWRSDLFEITSPIDSYDILNGSDGPCWEFTDSNIEQQLPARGPADILLAITNVPLEQNYYARRLPDNKVCITYCTMTEILEEHNIPLKNLILRLIYTSSFVYKRYGNQIPPVREYAKFTHDETRGCIFDMNGIKSDVIYSLNSPQICASCVENLRSNQQNRIENNLINKAQNELKKIKKEYYYRLADFVKRRPFLTLLISSLLALMLGVTGSLIATVIWEKALNHL